MHEKLIKSLIIPFSIIVSFGIFNPAFALSRDVIKEIVVYEAITAGIKPSLALAVAKVESNFKHTALSHAGARGVMQIMPSTALGEYGMPADRLWDARTNIRLGVRFLRKLINQYKGRFDLALSHYNGGTIHNNRPHSYTREYVRKVLEWEKRYDQNNFVAESEHLIEKSYKHKDYQIITYLSTEFYNDFLQQQENRFAIQKLKDEVLRRKQKKVTASYNQNEHITSRVYPLSFTRKKQTNLGVIVRWDL